VRPVAAKSRAENDSGVDLPETRYARTVDGLSIAYQVLGQGPIDLVYSPGWISNVDACWDVLPLRSFFRQLASISRLILFDRRGSGLSDRPTQVESLALEHGVDDLRAVMDAAQSDRAVLFGLEDGGMLAGIFAASHPDRTVALVLFAPWAKTLKTRDYPFGWSDAEQEEWERHLGTEWGTTAFTRWQFTVIAPGLEGDEALIQAFTRYWRACASPAAVKAIDAMQLEVDARPVLRSIHVPTLVMNRIDDRLDPVEEARFIAGAIPSARLVELPGAEHPPFLGDTDRVLDELHRFITSIRTQEAALERVLATVLFTDIVGSTDRAAALGDHAWGEALERHHELVRAMLARYRGEEVDTAGDGFFATFDGPARAAKCAKAIVEGVKPLGIEVRAGVHTGEVETIAGKTGGMAVVIGSRVGAKAQASEVLASQTVKDLTAGSGLVFEDAGDHELKGVPNRWRLYRVLE
jgi:pimeloyl-ACP methyl ester carboxylesterase/class 3 adenylate cyclase